MLIHALRKGDRVVETIINLLSTKEIKSGLIVGIGAFSEVTLMVYDLQIKEYLSKSINEQTEVGSFTAIIGKDPDGNTHIHPHVVVSNKEFNTFAGHLKEATVAATFEIVIFKSDQEVKRYKDSEIGLNLIK